MSFFKHSKQLLLVLCLSVFIVACAKISQANYDKIKPSMSMKDVIAILGQPTTSDSFNVAGISGTSATWKSGKAEINIQFINDQVTVKTFNSQDDKDKPSQD